MANQLARMLRRSPTPAEAKLWQELRLLKVRGFHFRRQAPMGPYIVDFVCHRIRLVIEADGDQHGFDENRKRDRVRTKWLESRGYRVIRFSNTDVLTDLESVLDTIHAQLKALYSSTAVSSPAQG